MQSKIVIVTTEKLLPVAILVGCILVASNYAFNTTDSQYNLILVFQCFVQYLIPAIFKRTLQNWNTRLILELKLIDSKFQMVKNWNKTSENFPAAHQYSLRISNRQFNFPIGPTMGRDSPQILYSISKLYR